MPVFPHARRLELILPRRISFCTSFLSLAWFLTAHVLEYTSLNTCRFAAPHLWWLTFGILCTLYLMILEIFLLGLLVFILGPVLYVRISLSRPPRVFRRPSCSLSSLHLLPNLPFRPSPNVVLNK